MSSVKFQAALYASPQGQRPHRLEAADCCEERIDRQDHHRRRAADLTAITLSGSERRIAAGSIWNVGVSLQIARASQRRRLCHQPHLCGGVERHRLQQGYPTISQRGGDSATVRDGNSSVIGGLTQDENITNNIEDPDPGTSRSSARPSEPIADTRSRTSCTSSSLRTSCIASAARR